jgi:ribosomal protein S18 acetylase RimI-like enzyme
LIFAPIHRKFCLMNPNATLRRAGEQDLETLLPLFRHFYEHFGYAWSEPPKRRAIAELLADPSAGSIWLILSDDKLAGYLVLSFYFSIEYDGRTAFIDELWVENAARGRGLGTAALELMAAECPALGVRRLHLEADRTNPRAWATWTTAAT